jgi:uncharacterized membrane protein YhaH (DUF805 family)
LFLFNIVASIVAGLAPVEAVGYVVLLIQFMAGVNLLLIAIRRYHDRGRSGWWLLLQGTLATVLAIVGIAMIGGAALSSMGGATSDAQSFGAAALVALVLLLPISIWYIVWLSLPGKPEKNRFDD